MMDTGGDGEGGLRLKVRNVRRTVVVKRSQMEVISSPQESPGRRWGQRAIGLHLAQREGRARG